jgi:hypothetical protein
MGKSLRTVFMSTDLFRDSPLIQSLLKEAAEEAKVEGMRELAQAALEGRFQTLSDDMLQTLGTADEATLKGIVAHVSSDTLEQVRERLGLGPQG